jgi:hypothetical protein
VNAGDPPDLDIAPTSPAINAGNVLGANIVGVHDYAGRKRTKDGTIDIGAYQR